MAAFYERLFAGDTVSAAVTAGRRRLFLRNLRPSPRGDMPLADWIVPVHYLHREVSFPLARTERRAGELSLDEALDRLGKRGAPGDGGGRGPGPGRPSWRRRSGGGGGTPAAWTIPAGCSCTLSSRAWPRLAWTGSSPRAVSGSSAAISLP